MLDAGYQLLDFGEDISTAFNNAKIILQKYALALQL